MQVRTATLRSLAKVNLDLRVLHKRPDGYHELRTVFQTISLSDQIQVSYSPSKRTEISIQGNIEIQDNLIGKIAHELLDMCCCKGLFQFNLQKNIPMGGGLGGGSSNAAAVLLALPVLIGRRIPLQVLEKISGKYGSDISFFLYGGTCLGLGRGTELYPLPEIPRRKGILVAPQVHVATGAAYADLARGSCETPVPSSFQQFVRDLGMGLAIVGDNDFESVIYRKYRKLRMIHRALEEALPGAVRMSGSGSSIYAFFDGKPPSPVILKEYPVYEIETVSRRQYQSMWRRQLREHITPGEIWPPQSRYEQ